MRRCSALLLPAITCAITACGGGGGGSAPPPPPPNPPANTAPTFTATSFNATEDTDLAAAVTATDAQSQTISFALVTNPAHGTVSGFSASGTFIYLGAANFSGTDTFTVRATDSAGAQTTATVTVTVAPVNDAPTIRDDVLTASGTNPLLDVVANDTEPDNETLTVTLVGTPDFGTAAVENGRIRLTLPAGFQGYNTFSYRAVDAAGTGATARAVVFVDAQPVRFVYLTNEEGDYTSSLYVDDLLARRRVAYFDLNSPTGFGRWLYASKNGRTLLYDEVESSFSAPRKFWVAAAVDGSSGPRRLNPPLTAGQSIELASNPSPDGRWATYRIINAGVDQHFYIVDVTGNAAPREIVAPAGTARIDSWSYIKFDEQSQYIFVPVSMEVASGVWGMTIYRAPVTDPTALQPFFSPAAANLETTVADVAPDGSRAIVNATDSLARGLYLVRATDPLNPVRLTPEILDPNLTLGSYLVDWTHDRLIFNVDSVSGITPVTNTLYTTNLATGTWTALGSLPGDYGSPRLEVLHPSGAFALYETRVLDPMTGAADEAREVELVAGAPSRLIEHSNSGKVMQYTNAGEAVLLALGGATYLHQRNDLAHPKMLFTEADAYNCRLSPDGKIVMVDNDDSVWAVNQTTGPGTFAKRLVQVTKPANPYVSPGYVVPRY